MTEKMDKMKQSTQMKHIPKDAQVIMSIMKDMEVTEYEPRVINQLLEFTYKYVACVLEDAKTYANHAKNRSIDLDDVKLALEIQLEQTFTATPPREVISEMARSKNSIQLPLIKPHCGIRLPQDRFCLSTSNLQLKLSQFSKKNVKMSGQYGVEKNLKIGSKHPNMGLVKRSSNLPLVARTQSVSVPKPVPKFSNMQPKAFPKPKINISQSSTSMVIDEDVSTSIKRKRETDDYDSHM